MTRYAWTAFFAVLFLHFVLQALHSWRFPKRNRTRAVGSFAGFTAIATLGLVDLGLVILTGYSILDFFAKAVSQNYIAEALVSSGGIPAGLTPDDIGKASISIFPVGFRFTVVVLVYSLVQLFCLLFINEAHESVTEELNLENVDKVEKLFPLIFFKIEKSYFSRTRLHDVRFVLAAIGILGLWLHIAGLDYEEQLTAILQKADTSMQEIVVSFAFSPLPEGRHLLTLLPLAASLLLFTPIFLRKVPSSTTGSKYSATEDELSNGGIFKLALELKNRLGDSLVVFRKPREPKKTRLTSNSDSDVRMKWLEAVETDHRGALQNILSLFIPENGSLLNAQSLYLKTFSKNMDVALLTARGTGKKTIIAAHIAYQILVKGSCVIYLCANLSDLANRKNHFEKLFEGAPWFDAIDVKCYSTAEDVESETKPMTVSTLIFCSMVALQRLLRDRKSSRMASFFERIGLLVIGQIQDFELSELQNLRFMVERLGLIAQSRASGSTRNFHVTAEAFPFANINKIVAELFTSARGRLENRAFLRIDDDDFGTQYANQYYGIIDLSSIMKEAEDWPVRIVQQALNFEVFPIGIKSNRALLSPQYFNMNWDFLSSRITLTKNSYSKEHVLHFQSDSWEKGEAETRAIIVHVDRREIARTFHDIRCSGRNSLKDISLVFILCDDPVEVSFIKSYLHIWRLDTYDTKDARLDISYSSMMPEKVFLPRNEATIKDIATRLLTCALIENDFIEEKIVKSAFGFDAVSLINYLDTTSFVSRSKDGNSLKYNRREDSCGFKSAYEGPFEIWTDHVWSIKEKESGRYLKRVNANYIELFIKPLQISGDESRLKINMIDYRVVGLDEELKEVYVTLPSEEANLDIRVVRYYDISISPDVRENHTNISAAGSSVGVIRRSEVFNCTASIVGYNTLDWKDNTRRFYAFEPSTTFFMNGILGSRLEFYCGHFDVETIRWPWLFARMVKVIIPLLFADSDINVEVECRIESDHSFSLLLFETNLNDRSLIDRVCDFVVGERNKAHEAIIAVLRDLIANSNNAGSNLNRFVDIMNQHLLADLPDSSTARTRKEFEKHFQAERYRFVLDDYMQLAEYLENTLRLELRHSYPLETLSYEAIRARARRESAVLEKTSPDSAYRHNALHRFGALILKLIPWASSIRRCSMCGSKTEAWRDTFIGPVCRECFHTYSICGICGLRVPIGKAAPPYHFHALPDREVASGRVFHEHCISEEKFSTCNICGQPYLPYGKTNNRNGSICPECSREIARNQGAVDLILGRIQDHLLSILGIEIHVDGTETLDTETQVVWQWIHSLTSITLRKWLVSSGLESKLAEIQDFDRRAWSDGIVEWIALEMLRAEGYSDIAQSLFFGADPDSPMAIGYDRVEDLIGKVKPSVRKGKLLSLPHAEVESFGSSGREVKENISMPEIIE